MSEDNNPKSKRMSITLPKDVLEDLEYLAKSHSLSLNRAINKAITTEAYIRKHCMNGGSVLLKKSDGSQIEVVFR